MQTVNVNAAAAKLQTIVDTGKARVAAGLSALKEETIQRKDFIARPSGLDYYFKDGKLRIGGHFGDLGNTVLDLTDHARAQLLSRARIPQTYADTLSEIGETGLNELLLTNLRTTTRVFNEPGLMLRTVPGALVHPGGKGWAAKAVLSPSYKRLDSLHVAEDVIEALFTAGLVPYRSEVTEARVYVSFIRPEVLTIGNDAVVVGVEFRSSDYGKGAVEINLMVLRLICLNGATGSDLFRMVHLGRRFNVGEGAESVQLSQATMDLDLQTVRSGLRDVMSHADRKLAGLRAVLEERLTQEGLTAQAFLRQLKTMGIKKAVAEKAVTLYKNEALPIEALPPTQGLWRASNVLSLMANGETKGEDAMDLRAAAWKLLGIPANVKEVA